MGVTPKQAPAGTIFARRSSDQSLASKPLLNQMV